MTHSINYDIDKAMRNMILSIANNNPAPILGKVVKISDDLNYADILLNRGGVLPTVKCLGIPILGEEILLVFPDADLQDPRALCFEKPNTIQSSKTYNIINNGNFEQTLNNTFKNWTGGIIDKTEHYYGNNSCKLNPDQTLTSEYISLDEITNSNEAFTVSFLWKGGGLKIQTLTKNGGLINGLPSRMGTTQTVDDVPEWSFQRFNFELVQEDVQLKFTNRGKQPTYLDGIRIWKPDDFQEWFPSKSDLENGGVKE